MFEENVINVIVIENKIFFRELVNDFYRQLEKEEGKLVLSLQNKPVDIHKQVILLTDYISFDINQKTLLTKIYAQMEKTALSEENYMQTQELIARINRYVFEMAQNVAVQLDVKQITAQSIIKMVAPTISNQYSDLLEEILDYMELVREFEGDRLFVFVNMRNYYSDTEMKLFFETINLRKTKALFIESSAFSFLPYEKRLVIDEDLCEI